MAAAFQAVTTHTQGEMGVVGAVLEASSDKPLADVIVTGSLRQAGRERENVVVTDRQGRFRMSGLYENPSADDVMCDACTIRFEVEDHYSVARRKSPWAESSCKKPSGAHERGRIVHLRLDYLRAERRLPAEIVEVDQACYPRITAAATCGELAAWSRPRLGLAVHGDREIAHQALTAPLRSRY